MKIIKFKKFFTVLIIFCMSFLICISSINNSNYNNFTIISIDDNSLNTNDSKSVKSSSISYGQDKVIGVIDNRDGKIFSNITTITPSCYINRDQPDLNNQPKLYIPNWNITFARMNFQNITAINYTYKLESEPSEFLGSPSTQYPFYVFQKFWVELDQYINNASIFIQDIANQYEYNENNSWEVAIFNCSNDKLGTPNSSLGALLKPHPFTLAAHWEIFDFNNSKIGPIFLNISQTNYTSEDGFKKYWFALRIRIPPDDSHLGGGPKFLYFNPSENAELTADKGATFATFWFNVFNANITETHVINYTDTPSVTNGTKLYGTFDSFKFLDDNRYLAQSLTNNFTLQVQVEIGNLTNGALIDVPMTFNETNKWIKKYPNAWNANHMFLIHGFDIYLATNVSNVGIMNNATMYLLNYSSGKWRNISDTFELLNAGENLQLIQIRDPVSKALIIDHMNFTNDRNIFTFKFEYNSTGNQFNISINQFKIDVLYLRALSKPVPYKPQIQELYYPTKFNVINGKTIGDNSTETLRLNDNNCLFAQSKTNNLTLEFDFNFAPYLNSSYWGVDIYDWQYLWPNPVIPRIDFRLSSNVSITSEYNLTHAILEVYKGNKTIQWMTKEQKELEWFPISPNKTFAFQKEYQLIFPYPTDITWIIMQFINASKNNLIRFRFRYVWNETVYPLAGTFNVTIDEFAFILYLQNAKPSLISSTIGFGLNSLTLKPSDIKLQNFGTDVSDILSYREGTWEATIENSILYQGYYAFNITSIWSEIRFDVNGTYKIEAYQNFDWEFELGNADDRVTWYAAAEIEYYEYYDVILESRGLQVIVPSDWKVMNVYNYTSSTQGIGGGGWSWINETIGTLKRVSVFNISDGKWKVKMNSSIYSMDVSYSDTKDVMIDNNIAVDVLIPNHYGGTISFEVHDSNDHLVYEDSITLNKTARENSTSFSWDIFATTQTSGKYSLTTYWMDYNQSHAFVSLETKGLEVSKYATMLRLMDIETFKNESIMGTKILISGNLTMKNPGEPIEGETIIFEISSVGGVIDNLTDITNEEGIVQVEYTLPEGYEWIKIKLVYNSTGTFYDETESTKMIKMTLISQLQYNMNIFLLFLPYILAVAGGISVFVVYRQLRLRKMREFWAGEALVLDDLLKISYIMIILKDVGVTIYNNQISMQLDSDLIGGFLTAISQFRSEIKKSEKQPVEGKIIGEGKESVEEKDLVERVETVVPKGFEMDYYDFKIVITDGTYVRVALILDGTPSEKLKESQWVFTNEFEDKFKPILVKFTGDVKPFKETDQLVEKYFDISLMYPLQVGKHWEVIQLNTLEKALMEVAEQVQKEKKFFFVSTLLSFGLAGRKQSRDQIISTILNLKRKGLLVPLEMK